MIIDESTQREITDPDLSAGVLIDALWASPEAIASVDGVIKPALADDDYQWVQMYHRYTDEEIANIEQEKKDLELRNELMSLPDAILEIAAMLAELME